MEEVVILGADGRPVKGMQLDRNTIHLGEANGGYMGCTKESVTELQQERLERFTKNRKAHQKECMSAACDITPTMLAGFDNPYDEIHNLILQGYNNAIEAQGLFYRVVNQDAEMRRLRRRVIEEMTAKELATEFILSSGNVEAFRKFCEERTERRSDDREETGKVRLFVR
ncbi:hypothetical protein [Bacteroides congonensis]|uniref:hypothetical protein n=1 Tax=Bacteroides congonensis TaxID=1871006 RepID=UPI003A8C0FF9